MIGTMTFTSNSPAQTREIAMIMFSILKGGELIALNGELGAGKTEFVRGLAEAMGIADQVSSPSFVLENIYSNGSTAGVHKRIKRLFHWDFYRLNIGEAPADLLENLGTAEALTVVEWPERIDWPDYVPIDISIDFAFDAAASINQNRSITLHSSHTFLAQLATAMNATTLTKTSKTPNKTPFFQK